MAYGMRRGGARDGFFARRLGRERAERAYHRCRDAIDALERAVRCSRLDSGFERLGR